MGKKCVICSEEASYCIKGTSDFYCEECARENFSDIDLLEEVESQAKAIKDLIKQKEENMENPEKVEKEKDNSE